jgi:hypothetical protein
VKRFAQKEICYRTIQEAKAVARPAEITFFFTNMQFRGKCRGKNDLPSSGSGSWARPKSHFLAGAEPVVPWRDCGEESTGLCIGS